MTDEPYAYTSGNPLQYIDPLGLCSWRELGSIGSDCYGFMDSNAFMNTSDTVAGFGDGMTMGGTAQIRNLMGAQGVVCETSAAYAWGGYTSIATSFVVPGGGIALASKGSKVGSSLKSFASSLQEGIANGKNYLSLPRYLYRGVSKGHDGYQDALRGIAAPCGGPLPAAEHTNNNLKHGYSNFTSWSPERRTAEFFARDDGVIIAISRRQFRNRIADINHEYEAEYLLTGKIKGKVIPWKL